MRYVIYGAGAVGGTIGARLHQHGHDVVLIARGAHLEAMRRDGLWLRWPDGDARLSIPVAGSPAEVDWSDDHVAVLAMKTQDTQAALDGLAAAAPPGLPVVCAQNGVENERLALRRFPHVYGMCVMLPATHLEPGVVIANGAPLSGILDLGRYPAGVDAQAEQMASDLDDSQFSSRAVPAIMRFKYRKLIMNLGNALQAACGEDARGSDLYARAADEALAVFAAAGIDAASEEEDLQRREGILRLRPVGGERRGGGSSWQSLARGTGSIEADYLNGEIVLLGRQHGVPTPVNALLQEVAGRLARDGASPGSLSIEDLQARLG